MSQTNGRGSVSERAQDNTTVQIGKKERKGVAVGGGDCEAMLHKHNNTHRQAHSHTKTKSEKDSLTSLPMREQREERKGQEALT